MEFYSRNILYMFKIPLTQSMMLIVYRNSSHKKDIPLKLMGSSSLFSYLDIFHVTLYHEALPYQRQTKQHAFEDL